MCDGSNKWTLSWQMFHAMILNSPSYACMVKQFHWSTFFLASRLTFIGFRNWCHRHKTLTQLISTRCRRDAWESEATIAWLKGDKNLACLPVHRVQSHTKLNPVNVLNHWILLVFNGRTSRAISQKKRTTKCALQKCVQKLAPAMVGIMIKLSFWEATTWRWMHEVFSTILQCNLFYFHSSFSLSLDIVKLNRNLLRSYSTDSWVFFSVPTTISICLTDENEEKFACILCWIQNEEGKCK